MSSLGDAVAQLVEALRYRKVAGLIPDGIISPGVDPASNRNEFQEYFLG